LFRDTAFGMFHIIAPDNDFHARVRYETDLESDDLEELMVNWLSELNFYFQVKHYVPVKITLSFRQSGLTARISADIVDRSIHNIQTEIKAVTFHKIMVNHEKGLWKAQVIFDI